MQVIGNVFNRIGQQYYGFFSPVVRIDRRVGKPRAQHNADLCQACSEGECKVLSMPHLCVQAGTGALQVHQKGSGKDLYMRSQEGMKNALKVL